MANDAGLLRQRETYRKRKPRIKVYCSCGSRAQGLKEPERTKEGKILHKHRCSKHGDKRGGCLGY